jgi:hypothetical protein
MAKSGELNPWLRPIEVASEVTAEVWALGIPPELISQPQFHLRVIKKFQGTLINWAREIAINEVQRGKFARILSSINGWTPFHSSRLLDPGRGLPFIFIIFSCVITLNYLIISYCNLVLKDKNAKVTDPEIKVFIYALMQGSGFAFRLNLQQPY